MKYDNNLTDASRANQSGNDLESILESFLIEKNIPHIRQTAKNQKQQIDFIIDGRFYVECANQNVSGSVEDKIPHKIYKYYHIYKYKEVYVIRGSFIPNKWVIKHCDDISEQYNFKWHLLTFEEFCNKLFGTNISTNTLQKFF
jgi:hypothetical protein